MSKLFIAFKYAVKWLIYPPVIGLSMGHNSWVASPRKIRGRAHITIGRDTFIAAYSWIESFRSYLGFRYSPQITIGNKVSIGRYCCITATNHIEIEAGCLLSEYVYISDHSHGINPSKGLPAIQPLTSKGGVRIGAGSFLGYRVTVLPGVNLGKHCVVGSHSVVTHSFPDYSMIAGAPAVLIKTYCPNEDRWIPVNKNKYYDKRAH